MVRAIVAGIVGGAIMFIWGAFSHMLTPIGSMGLSNLPNDVAILESFRANLPQETERALYFFPAMPEGEMSDAAQEAYAERYRTGAVGLLVYRPIGGEVMPPRLLVNEFITNILAAIVAAVIVSATAVGYLGRVLILTALGAVGWLSISASYWNWYGFPDAYVSGELVDQVVGWFLSGLAIAAIARGRTTPVARPA